MKDIEQVRKYLIDLSGKPEQEVLSILKDDQVLDREQKGFIWNYMFPDPLLDYELPKLVGPYLSRVNGGHGFWQPDPGMLLHLTRAFRCDQYRNFIRHLLHTFIRVIPSPVSGKGHSHSCPICGKVLYEYDFWVERCSGPKASSMTDLEKKEYLAYGSDSSDCQLCVPCLMQLAELDRVLETLYPGYLEKFSR